jgi:hypothetical protein
MAPIQMLADSSLSKREATKQRHFVTSLQARRSNSKQEFGKAVFFFF